MSIKGRPATTFAALGIAVMLGTTVTACTREESGTPHAAETSPAQTSAPSAAGGAELLDPGAEPREVLRFTVAEGVTSRATLATSTQIGQQFGGEQVEEAPSPPPMLMDLSATVNKVAANGDIDYTFTIENVRVEGDTVSPEGQQALDQFFPVAGEASISATGEQLDFKVEAPPDADPQTRSMMEGMTSELATISVPFPTEPVGVGSSWRTRTSREFNGVRAELTTTYTLRERTGDRYVTEVSVEQTASDQEIDLSGFSAYLNDMTMSGSGETVGSLSMILPLTSTMQVSGTMDMSISDGQESQQLLQTIDSTIRLESIP